jgi:hypothetical protein
MPSLIRFAALLALLAIIGYAGMYALVTLVEPTPREFVVAIPQDRMGKKVTSAAPKRKTETAAKDRLETVEPERLAKTLESRQIPR